MHCQRPRSRLRPFVTIALLVCATPTQAQIEDGDSAKTVLVRRLLELTKAPDLIVTAMETSIPAQRAATPTVPAEFWDEFELRARRDVPRLVELLVPIYATHFTREQLDELVAFYETPLGQHLAGVQPLIAAESIVAGQGWGAALAEEIAQDLGIRRPSR